MAGINPIVTDGFLFTPSLIVTMGFGIGNPPPPPVITQSIGGSYPKQKKRKKQRDQWMPLGPSSRDSIMSTLSMFGEESDEEELLMLLMMRDL